MSVRTQKKPARSEAMSVERKTLYKSRQSVDRKILKNKIWAPKRIRLPSSRKAESPKVTKACHPRTSHPVQTNVLFSASKADGYFLSMLFR